jgi:hypothetical protein
MIGESGSLIALTYRGLDLSSWQRQRLLASLQVLLGSGTPLSENKAMVLKDVVWPARELQLKLKFQVDDIMAVTDKQVGLVMQSFGYAAPIHWLDAMHSFVYAAPSHL